MDNVNAKPDQITIYGANGEIISAIADHKRATPMWAAHKEARKGAVLNAQGNPASVTVPVTYAKGTNGPVTVHDTTDKPLANGKAIDPRAITERLQGDHKGNPYTASAAYDEGTSGEGKANGAMFKFRKATLQCALWQLHGKAFDLNGKVKHVSAMNKAESVQVLAANEVTIGEIEAMIYYLAPITE